MISRHVRKQCGVIGSLIIVALAPLLFQAKRIVSPAQAELRLTVISPHNESIRREFSTAFYHYYKEKSGKSVYIDWLSPGGTSEIRRVIDDKFSNAQKHGKKGIGIDVFFGGGEYDFSRQASFEPKRFVPLEVFEQKPEWFEDSVIPQSFSGEVYYEKERHWVGTCLSQFGICYNTDLVERLGNDDPKEWSDLADPSYFGKIALADPQKSGSTAKAFEMLIQQTIQEKLATTIVKTAETEQQRRDRAIRHGWADGLNLIQRISANARYFTDSATKIPLDVAQGDAAAGMCVDFYGRAYHQKHKKDDGTSRLEWISPKAGSSVSVDPVAIFRGAPAPELAQEFVTFLLSEHGQLLWNARAGVEGGPEVRSLGRLPVRRDMYTVTHLAKFANSEANPYENHNEFTYHPEYTAAGFNAMRMIIRVMCIDVHDELVEAWQALIEADFPERATHHFHDVAIVSYERTMGEIREQIKSGKQVETLGMRKRLASVFRRNYQQTIRLAAQR